MSVFTGANRATTTHGTPPFPLGAGQQGRNDATAKIREKDMKKKPPLNAPRTHILLVVTVIRFTNTEEQTTNTAKGGCNCTVRVPNEVYTYPDLVDTVCAEADE